MLWPVVLPFKITFCMMIALVVVITAIAPALKWKRLKAFINVTIVATVTFIPSCTGILYVVDRVRFGYFEYPTFSAVRDFRAERYLPTTAINIKMHKQENGYRAQYEISDANFQAYLNQLWDQYGKFSAVERGKMSGEGSPVSQQEFEHVFSDIGWKPLQNAVKFHSPTESDGGGATYYFDPKAGIAYQRTGYW